MSAPAWIQDVPEARFQSDVVERSHTCPVVVDFWAPWCAPCRALGPLLDRLAEEHQGAFVLAKVNIDEAQALAQQLGVRSIPAVLGLRDGKIAAEFNGAQSETFVRAFLAQLLPSEADRRVAEADAQRQSGALAEAEAGYAAALEDDPRHAGAHYGVAELRAARGDRAGALAALENVAADGPLAADVERLAARLRTDSASVDDLDALRARADADPGDLAARLALGRALAASQRYEEALDALLTVVRRDPGFDDQGARKAMLDVFEILGAEHPLTGRFRSDLARALFR